MTPKLGLDVVLHAIARRLKPLLVLCVAAPVLASVAWSALPDRYEARARVTVQAPQTINPFLGDLAVEWDAEERVALITSVLRSPATVTSVLRTLGEAPRGIAAEELDGAVRALTERIQVIAVGGGVVLLKVLDPDPDRAFRAARALVDVFVSEMLRPQRENVAASAEFLQRKVTQLERELAEAERRVTVYRQTHADEVPEMRTATLLQHQALRTALVDAEVRAESARRRVATTAERLRDYAPRERALESLLAEATTVLEREQATLEPDHPRVTQSVQRVERLRAELARARRATARSTLREVEQRAADAPVSVDAEGRASGLDVLTSEVLAYRSLVRDQEGAEAEVELLRERIERARGHLVASVGVEEELGRMTRELEARRTVLRDLRERLEQARVVRDLAQDGGLQQVWVIEPPVRPSQSQKPARWMVAFAAAVGALLLGLLAIGLAEASARYARTPEDAAARLGGARAASLPRLGERS